MMTSDASTAATPPVVASFSVSATLRKRPAATLLAVLILMVAAASSALFAYFRFLDARRYRVPVSVPRHAAPIARLTRTL
jgi:hypothetical protein